MFILNVEFNSLQIGTVFQAVANCFGSIGGTRNLDNGLETNFRPYEGIDHLESLFLAVTKVAAEWKEVSATYAHVFERRWTPFHFDFLVSPPSQDVIITVKRGTIQINFGRDSKSLSEEMIQKLSATTVDDLEMYNEKWESLKRRVSSPSY